MSDYGSDGSDCQTESTPCKNLQTVLNRAADGADIYVTSDELSLDAVHDKFEVPWWSYLDDCCEVKSSFSYSISRLNGRRFTLTCICKYNLLLNVRLL